MEEIYQGQLELVKLFGISKDKIKVSKNDSGVWGNILYRLILPEKTVLYKEFISFDLTTINYSPPAVLPRERLEISVKMQELAIKSISDSKILVPKIITVSKTSFIMEFLEPSTNLKRLLDRGDSIPNLAPLGRGIAQFQNSNKDANFFEFQHNEMLKYKINIQYIPHQSLKLTPEECCIFKELYNEIIKIDEDLPIVHGDFNSKNIIILNSDKLGLIDFEHSGILNRIYDLVYIIADIVIAFVLYPQKVDYIDSIIEFLDAYFTETNLSSNTFKSIWGHTGVQLLYRITGPSSITWTSYFSNEAKNNIKKVGKFLLKQQFIVKNIKQVLQLAIS
ncbi:aminoglycoside phosphotransferase family protein [uncultured Streptococcus sp.]|jgi:thiamine kinase-like enzyme|uniref:aminoglycoside phosphotransferase family protein n=1 Tax=uncultured Streptococcus sp. TaxID=83427 RepID=UPI0025D654FC|nr:aminoglycoside phosphotransferase family protein [uncultured Streptococcus sp.]